MKLGMSGVVRGFEVNTAFFTGNQVPRVSIQAACLDRDIDVLPEWSEIPRKGTKASPEVSIPFPAKHCSWYTRGLWGQKT